MVVNRIKNMETINVIKEQVCEKGLNTLLKRMQVIFTEYDLKQLTKPMIVSAEIVDLEKVISKIKQTYTCFDIKDVKIDLKGQNVKFKIYGSCFIPEKYRGYIIMEWSPVQTEACNYCKTIKEEYAEENVLPISNFVESGIKVEIL